MAAHIHVPDPLDTLQYLSKHLVRHLFAANDTRPLLLKWRADIVSLVERHAESIDWGTAQQRDPGLLNRLQVIYSLALLPERLGGILPVKLIAAPAGG